MNQQTVDILFISDKFFIERLARTYLDTYIFIHYIHYVQSDSAP